MRGGGYKQISTKDAQTYNFLMIAVENIAYRYKTYSKKLNQKSNKLQFLNFLSDLILDFNLKSKLL